MGKAEPGRVERLAWEIQQALADRLWQRSRDSGHLAYVFFW